MRKLNQLVAVVVLSFAATSNIVLADLGFEAEGVNYDMSGLSVTFPSDETAADKFLSGLEEFAESGGGLLAIALLIVGVGAYRRRKSSGGVSE